MLVGNCSLLHADPITECSAKSRVRETCLIDVKNVKPTQFSLGPVEVTEWQLKIRQTIPSNMTEFLGQHRIPLIIAPNGEFFMIREHELAKALIIESVVKGYGYVFANLSSGDWKNFWNAMKSAFFYRLIDEDGQFHSLDELKSLKNAQDLQDDFYLSLAEKTRCNLVENCLASQWNAQGHSNLSFVWAEYFRRTASVAEALEQPPSFNQFQAALSAAKKEIKRLGGEPPRNLVDKLLPLLTP